MGHSQRFKNDVHNLICNIEVRVQTIMLSCHLITNKMCIIQTVDKIIYNKWKYYDKQSNIIIILQNYYNILQDISTGIII